MTMAAATAIRMTTAMDTTIPITATTITDRK